MTSAEAAPRASNPSSRPGWLRLLLAPQDFIRHEGRHVRIVLPVLICGLASALDRLDARALFDPNRVPQASWAMIFLGALLASPILGFASYWIGGTFNWVRARLVSVERPDGEFCRRVSVLTSLIALTPTILIWAAAPLRFDSPAGHLASPTLHLAPIVFALWGSWGTYATMADEYSIRGPAAVILFLVLPFGFYATLFFGLIGFTLYQSSGL